MAYSLSLMSSLSLATWASSSAIELSFSRLFFPGEERERERELLFGEALSLSLSLLAEALSLLLSLSLSLSLSGT
jgi:hypothetical protein